MIENGQSISLWFDCWIDQIPIVSRFPRNQLSYYDQVSDIIIDNHWQIPTHLPPQLMDYLARSTCSISIGDIVARDHLLWNGSPFGKLSSKEAWNQLRTRGTNSQWSRLIWTNFINPMLPRLSWRLMQRKTPIESWAKQRGWLLASRCHNC